jgi:hypothetical protein
MRDFRSDTTVLGRVLIPAMEGRAQIPIAQLADIRQVPGLSGCLAPIGNSSFEP